MNDEDDFELECESSGDSEYYEIDCKVKAVSQEMQRKYKGCNLGSILLAKDKFTLEYLENKYNIPAEKTIILELIIRGKECETLELKSKVGINMLCGLLELLNIEYIYLVAINDKLVNYYEKVGFSSLEENSREMFGKVSNILQRCNKKMRVRMIS